MTRFSFLLLFLLPQPILGQTVGTLFITEDTTLTENHEGNIIIDADGVTLDCHFFTVSGTGSGNGIELTNRSGVRVRRCNVQGFTFGFDINFSSDNMFEENMSENNRNGFRLAGSSSNTFTKNISENNVLNGILILRESDGNTFTENTVSGNTADGFFLSRSSNNTLTKNNADNNGQNGFNVVATSELNTFIENEGCGNAVFDARDGSTGAGNVWVDNDFCTTFGF